MDNTFETGFITKTVDKTPFVDPNAQNFFIKWCEINDSIVPQFISREEWQQRGLRSMLEKNDQGTQTLFLPEDLHLWDILDVITTIDHDALARKPQRHEDRTDLLKSLGETFEKAGLYLAEYLPEIQDDNTNARQIAESIATEFYQYGLSIQQKQKISDAIPQGLVLSQEDKIKLDEWFLGKEAYQKRLARLGENPTIEQIEDYRKKILRTFFRALAKEGYKGDGKNPWETETGPIQHLHDRVKTQITKAIEIPERELKTAIFRRGLEKLVTEMKEVGWKRAVNNTLTKLGFNPILEQQKLYDVLHLDELKQELEMVRFSGDTSKISSKELEIAKKIQKAVCSFPYQEIEEANGRPNYPSEIVKTQYIDCLGSSILGGSLLQELGIKYLHALVPFHSATVLLTSDGKAYWQDFTPGTKYMKENYTELTRDILEGSSLDTSNIPNSGISITFAKYFHPYSFLNEQLTTTLFTPEVGLQCLMLNNTGVVLSSLGKKEEAIEAFKQAIALEPKSNYPYSGLGAALRSIGKPEEAIEAFKQAIALDPKHSETYHGLGAALYDLDKDEEAIEAFKQAITLDPKDSKPYNGLGAALYYLDRYEEAIEAFKQAIALEPKSNYPYIGLGNTLRALGKDEDAIKAYQTFLDLNNGDEYLIDRAKKIIEELQQK